MSKLVKQSKSTKRTFHVWQADKYYTVMADEMSWSVFRDNDEKVTHTEVYFYNLVGEDKQVAGFFLNVDRAYEVDGEEEKAMSEYVKEWKKQTNLLLS